MIQKETLLNKIEDLPSYANGFEFFNLYLRKEVNEMETDNEEKKEKLGQLKEKLYAMFLKHQEDVEDDYQFERLDTEV